MYSKKWLYMGLIGISSFLFGCGGSEGLNKNMPWYIALGASITNGVGVGQGEGHVPQFHMYLEQKYFYEPTEFIDLSVPGATSDDILQDQVYNSTIFEYTNLTNHHIISVAAGGNDLLGFMNSADFAVCAKPDLTDCFAALISILTEYENNLDDTFSTIRAFSPDAVLLVRNQFNPLMKTGCDPYVVVELAHAALNGAVGTPISEGLNGVLKRKAEEYGGHVVEIVMPFMAEPDTLVGTDCVHPALAGYTKIFDVFTETLQAI